MAMQPATNHITLVPDAASGAAGTAWLSDRGACGHRADEMWALFRPNPLREGVGAKGDEPLDHATGAGWVRGRGGDYADALSKGSAVHLLLHEVYGGMGGSAPSYLGSLCTTLQLVVLLHTRVWAAWGY